MRSYFIFRSCGFILSMICLVPYTGWTQQKDTLKTITPYEYDKWYDIENRGLSQKGSWLSFYMYYPGSDTLVIQQTWGNKKYMIANAGGMKFLGDSLVSFNQNDRSYLMSLNSGRREAFSPGTGFLVSNNEQYLLAFHKPSETLVLRSLQDNDSLVLTGISEYYYNKVFEGVCALSCNTTGKIDIIRLDKGFPGKNIQPPLNREILELKWHPTGNFLTFTVGRVQNSQDQTDVGLVVYYDIRNDKSSYLDPVETGGFPKDHIIISHNMYPLELSPDGKQVFFAHKPENIPVLAKNPEIWKWDDPYVRQSISYWSNNTPKISMWDPAGNKYMVITDQSYPGAFYGMAKDYVLVYNPVEYRYFNKLNNVYDIYLLDLESGERKLLAKKFIDSPKSMNVSPTGRYVVYSNDEQWWCHDIQKNVLINLTQKLETVSGIKSDSWESAPEGWAQNETGIYMHDRYDLWSIALDDKLSERKTRGRENGVCFKLINNVLKTQSELRNNRGIYLDDSILFFAVSKGDKMGYACKRNNDKIIFLSMEEGYIRWPQYALKTAPNKKVVSFNRENYNIPPAIMVCDLHSDTIFKAFQSNPHYTDYQWYERKRITYHNKTGTQLTGILYYPMNFKQDSLYPMVVHVYEKQSKYWQQYINPSYDNPIGFNQANLTADGYFVFLPDIEYETGEPGFSASDCIISGTKAVIENAPVDPARIGLIGQSFGGYETLFTITQTDLFATAIAGAAISDYPSDYLNMEPPGLLRFFQYEDSQLRMKRSLFDDYQGYLDNSPLYHAQNISVPFLLYTGGKDYHVNFTQTMAFHFAMKRLGKLNTMLIYPDEQHAFLDPENKRDLTLKVQEWFGHYLKGKPKQDWMP